LPLARRSARIAAIIFPLETGATRECFDDDLVCRIDDSNSAIALDYVLARRPSESSRSHTNNRVLATVPHARQYAFSKLPLPALQNQSGRFDSSEILGRLVFGVTAASQRRPNGATLPRRV
jgi:hypothetical protein